MPLILQVALMMDNSFDLIKKPEPAASIRAAAYIFAKNSVAGDASPEETKTNSEAAADEKGEAA